MRESRAYDPAGRLASVTDSMGWVTSYTYLDNGLTATVIRSDWAASLVATRSGASTPPPAPWPRTSAARASSAAYKWARAGPCGVSISRTVTPVTREEGA